MSDQTTPTPELDETESPAAETVVRPTAPSTPPPAPPIFADDDIDDDMDDDSFDDDDVDDSDEDERFTAPAQYVEREGSGRPRRIGSDVRIDEIDYKNIGLLSRFLDRRGRILSRRKTRVSAKVQRKIVREIKRARHLALLPYTADQTRIVRKRK
jgi:small subunit ribosomal protein S18